MAPLTALTALGTGVRPLATFLAVRCVHVAWHWQGSRSEDGDCMGVNDGKW